MNRVRVHDEYSRTEGGIFWNAKYDKKWIVLFPISHNRVKILRKSVYKKLLIRFPLRVAVAGTCIEFTWQWIISSFSFSRRTHSNLSGEPTINLTTLNTKWPFENETLCIYMERIYFLVDKKKKKNGSNDIGHFCFARS